MWFLGTWFSSGLGRARLKGGLRGLRGLFQAKWFCDFPSYDSVMFLGLFLRGRGGKNREGQIAIRFFLGNLIF